MFTAVPGMRSVLNKCLLSLENAIGKDDRRLFLVIGPTLDAPACGVSVTQGLSLAGWAWAQEPGP